MTPQGHVVLCGLGRFGLRLVEHLRRLDVPVTVLTTNATREDRQMAALDLGVELLHGDFRYADARVAAHLETARAVILATSDDTVNLETALDIRSELPNLRIVMRHSDPRRAVRLQSDFGIHAVLSPPDLAAPSFADAALEPAPTPKKSVRTTARRRRVRRPPRRDLYLLTTALTLLFSAGMIFFHRLVNLTWIDSAYFTASILTTVGFGDFNLRDQPPMVKLFGIVLMFGGVTVLATLSSFLTNFVLSGAAEQVRAERSARRLRGHIIICGIGNVGFAIAQNLRAKNLRVVVVDESPDDDLHRELSSRVPVILGDATRSDTLVRAGIDRARSVIAATSSDAINLEIALTAQTLVEDRRPDRPLRLVLRCFAPTLANRIHSISTNYSLLSAAEVSAPLFVAAALE